MRRHDHLAPPAQFLQCRQYRIEQKPVVEFIFRLVDDKRMIVCCLQQ